MIYICHWRMLELRDRKSNRMLEDIPWNSIDFCLFDCIAGFRLPDITWCTKSLWVWNWRTACAGDIRSTSTWYCTLQQTFWSSQYIAAYFGLGSYCTNLSRYSMWVGLFHWSYVYKSEILIGCNMNFCSKLQSSPGSEYKHCCLLCYNAVELIM